MLDLAFAAVKHPDHLLPWVVGAATFASVFWIWFALLERDRTVTRARWLAQTRRRMQTQAGAGRAGSRRAREESRLQGLIRQLRLMQASHDEKLRMRLLQAGCRSSEARFVFLIAKLAGPVAGGVLAGFLVYGLDIGGLSAQAKALPLVGGLLFGFYAPEIYLKNLKTKRRKALERSLPDGLDLLVVCAEAGLSLDTALERVASELSRPAPELSDELALTGIELTFLPERRQALVNLARRVDLPAMRGVVNTLVQTEKYGTPLTQSLRVLSQEFREHRMLRAEEKAARLPATLTVPMIIFILPTLFVVLGGPAALEIYDKLIK